MDNHDNIVDFINFLKDVVNEAKDMAEIHSDRVLVTPAILERTEGGYQIAYILQMEKTGLQNKVMGASEHIFPSRHIVNQMISIAKEYMIPRLHKKLKENFLYH